MLNRLEREIEIMIKKCDGVYATRNCNIINEWLENEYREFRSYWLERVDEDVFAETWNTVNRRLSK